MKSIEDRQTRTVVSNENFSSRTIVPLLTGLQKGQPDSFLILYHDSGTKWYYSAPKAQNSRPFASADNSIGMICEISKQTSDALLTQD